VCVRMSVGRSASARHASANHRRSSSSSSCGDLPCRIKFLSCCIVDMALTAALASRVVRGVVVLGGASSGDVWGEEAAVLSSRRRRADKHRPV
jgi:hypothetical protein